MQPGPLLALSVLLITLPLSLGAAIPPRPLRLHAAPRPMQPAAPSLRSLVGETAKIR